MVLALHLATAQPEKRLQPAPWPSPPFDQHNEGGVLEFCLSLFTFEFFILVKDWGLGCLGNSSNNPCGVHLALKSTIRELKSIPQRKSGKSNGGLGREENHVSSGNEGSLKLNNLPYGGIEEVSIDRNPVSSTEMAKESNGTNVPDQQRRRSDGTNGVEVSCQAQTVAARCPVKERKHSKTLRKGHIKSERKAGWGIVRSLCNPYEQSTEKGVQFSDALWKKIAECKNRCQSGKSNGGLERKESHVSSGNAGRLEHNGVPDGDNEELGSGEPPISSTKIAKDSFDVRPVPVWVHLVESDQDPVCLAPEIRTCSFNDLIQALSDDPALLSVDSVNELMRELILELGRWHDKGRIHRDLKPQNFLITEVSAKLPDIGTIHGDASYHSTDCENSGWRACEQLLGESPSRATNMFCVGCAWFMLLSCGIHPFGDHPTERDNNIWEDNMKLSSLELTPEAKYFFWRMLNGDPKLRPETWEVRSYFWSPEKKLRFYTWFSGILQSKSALGQDLLNEMESEDLVFYWEWINLIDPVFKDGIDRRNNNYDYSSVEDLVRLMRNLFSHPTGLKQIKGITGWDDGRIYSYFADLFPSLWLKSYRAASRFCGEEDWFKGSHREETFLGGAYWLFRPSSR